MEFTQGHLSQLFSPFHTSHDYLYGVLSCGFYHSHSCIFFHLSFNTLPGPICRRSEPLYLLYAEVQVFSKSTPISHLVEVRHGLDFHQHQWFLDPLVQSFASYSPFQNYINQLKHFSLQVIWSGNSNLFISLIFHNGCCSFFFFSMQASMMSSSALEEKTRAKTLPPILSFIH